MEVRSIQPYLHYPPISSFRWWSTETVAIVTGGNRGIGFAIVKKLARLGLTVILTARDEAKGGKAVDELLRFHGLHVHFHSLDLANPDSIKPFVSWFSKEFGTLDILVNNAAVTFNDIYENSVENAEIVMNTNFFGPKLLTESLLPLFRSSSSISRILNISSRLGSIDKMKNRAIKAMLMSENLTEIEIEAMVNLFIQNVKTNTWKEQGWPQVWPDYSVSKIALNAYSKLLAKRYENRGLSVNCFCPGFTRTAMTQGKGNYTADDAADVAARLVLLHPKELTTSMFYVRSSCKSYDSTISRL